MNENNIDWQEHNYRNLDKRAFKQQPNIDVEVSKIVGKKILATDSRLIKTVLKWRGNKPVDGNEPADNHLKDPEKIKELKKVLG